MSSSSNSVDGLPKQFVSSLRVLFDILDEDRSGYVRLTDIESRWHEEGVRGLPSGVIETLRKVAPRNGKLSFENFVSGLKLALLKNNGAGTVDSSSQQKRDVTRTVSPPSAEHAYQQQRTKLNPGDCDSGPNVYPNMQKRQLKIGSQTDSTAVRPNNGLLSQNIELRNQIYQRDQLQQSSTKPYVQNEQPHANDLERQQRHTTQHRQNVNLNHVQRDSYKKPNQTHRPKSAKDAQRPKEVRFNSRTPEIPPGHPERPPPYRKLHCRDTEAPPAVPPRNIYGHIVQELKNWQKESHIGSYGEGRKIHINNSDSKLSETNIPGHNIYINIDEVRNDSETTQPPSSSGATSAKSVQHNVRQQSSRRHTLSSGIDYNVIRRMKQLEQEKDFLCQGLQIVEYVHKWYMKQISMVTEKQNCAEKISYSDVTLQTNQEHVEFLQNRIMDVNLSLKALMESSEMVFPSHMNLATKTNVLSAVAASKWLKEQNRQLTQEVGEKSEKITQLEKEKASLIRELFDARSKHKSDYDDTTFM